MFVFSAKSGSGSALPRLCESSRRNLDPRRIDNFVSARQLRISLLTDWPLRPAHRPAPPRPADHKNQTVENFLISRALKYENGPSISIFILTIIHRGDYFPVSIILDCPNHNYWPFIVELKGIRWAGCFSEPLLSS